MLNIVKMRRKSPTFYFISGIILSAVVLVPFYHFFLINKIVNEELSAVKQKYNIFEENDYIDCVIATEDLPKGVLIDQSKLKVIQLPLQQLPMSYVSQVFFLRDRVSRISIPKNTLISDSMVMGKMDTLTDDLRRQDFFNVKIPEDLEANEYVDIRLKRSNGVDLIVAAKKKVQKINDGTTADTGQAEAAIGIPITWFNITEMDRINLNLAGLEKILNNAELYATVYVDAENQEEAKVTYQPDEKIKSLLSNNGALLQTIENFIKEESINNISEVQDNAEN